MVINNYLVEFCYVWGDHYTTCIVLGAHFASVNRIKNTSEPLIFLVQSSNIVYYKVEYISLIYKVATIQSNLIRN